MYVGAAAAADGTESHRRQRLIITCTHNHAKLCNRANRPPQSPLLHDVCKVHLLSPGRRYIVYVWGLGSVVASIIHGRESDDDVEPRNQQSLSPSHNYQ